ncbi:MAG: segregation and condensation protein A [Candidatus Malacoplasma girerdii]|nr:MAG: segregation and condensation protein A [Candidatus Malacoplasma girerdii]
MGANFNLRLKDFEGPLDLIDTLVREKKLDIMNLDVAAVAQQYLDFVRNQINTISIDEAAEYLEMAIYLIALKSKKAIPLENNISNENSFEYERDKLVQRIIEYRKYKAVADFLTCKKENRIHQYAKFSNDVEDFRPENLSVEKLPEKIDLQKLWDALNSAFIKYRSSLFAKAKIFVQELSVNKIEDDLWDYLSTNKIKQITFSEYFATLDEMEISQQYLVTLFLAILDLVKYGKISIEQNENLEIVINNNELIKEIK